MTWCLCWFGAKCKSRLDNNSFSGEVPASLNNLVNVIELSVPFFLSNVFNAFCYATFSGLAFGFSFRNLAYNSLTGLFPDLSKMESHTLAWVDVEHSNVPIPHHTVHPCFCTNDGRYHVLNRDLSNNYFSPTDVPDWLSNLPWLSTLYVLVSVIKGSQNIFLQSGGEIIWDSLKYRFVQDCGERIASRASTERTLQQSRTSICARSHFHGHNYPNV